MILALFLLLAAPDHALDELRRVEIEVELAKRRIPAAFELAEEERFVRVAAAQAGVEVRVHPVHGTERLGSSPILLHRLDIAGHAEPAALNDFLNFLATARTTRTADLESLHITRDGAFRIRYALPVLSGDVEQDPPTGNVSADIAARLQRQRALRDTLTALGQSGRFDSAREILDAFDALRAVRLTEVQIGDRRVVRGVVVGAAARAQVAKIAGAQLAPSGVCRPFAIGAAPAADDLLCRDNRPPTVHRVEVRGNGGPITMHLREADLSDFFFALHEITGESFVLAPDVRGVVTVSVENATLDEVLRATGLTIAGTRLRRVSRTPTRELTQEYTGDPVNLQLRNAGLPSILCLFQELTGLEMAVAEPTGRPSIFTRELPWDLALEGLVVTSGLTYTIDGTRVLIGPAADVQERRVRKACELAASSPSQFSDVHLKLPELGRDDLTIAGTARKGNEWTAWAYGPWRQLFVLAPGQTLFDARVKSVGPSGVAFEPIR